MRSLEIKEYEAPRVEIITMTVESVLALSGSFERLEEEDEEEM